jgi:DNA processing protein
MKKGLEYWIWLNELTGVGPVLQKRLLEHFESPVKVFNADQSALMAVSGIGLTLSKAICSARSLDAAYLRLELLHQKKINILTYQDDKYPDLAKAWPNNPVVFYYRGQIKNCDHAVSIIGSRHCSSYSKRISIEAAEFLANKKIPVIGGLAKGIEGTAHTACLQAGGYTIAFTGNGLDYCYPKEHLRLQEKISENGAVISQFPPETKPHPKFFLRRNEQIASFCKCLLIVEAGLKSGALHTATIAKQLKREILVPPHEIFDSKGAGSNLLLLDKASLYLRPSQLSGELIPEDANPVLDKTDLQVLTQQEEKIIKLLKDAPKNLMELEAESKMENTVSLLEILSTMELEGLITLQNGFYAID